MPQSSLVASLLALPYLLLELLVYDRVIVLQFGDLGFQTLAVVLEATDLTQTLLICCVEGSEIPELGGERGGGERRVRRRRERRRKRLTRLTS